MPEPVPNTWRLASELDSARASTGVLTERAFAKVNLYLHVTGRRADGYHLLDSLAVFSDAADVLTFTPGERFEFSTEGPFADGLPEGADNLVIRAARLLNQSAGSEPWGGKVTLRKNLPVASGIGGGSADAAAALRLLVRAWELPHGSIDLPRLALALGADVPVCLATRAARMEGVGERLSPAPALPKCGLVLANPMRPVATGDVFRARSGPFSAAAALPPAWTTAAELAAFLERTCNDLQPAAIALCPAISEVLTVLRGLPGCRFARMSGSGATCFALFDSAEQARASAAMIARPGWWVHGGRLLTDPPFPA